MEHRQSASHNEPRNEAQFSYRLRPVRAGRHLARPDAAAVDAGGAGGRTAYRGADGRIIRRDQGSAAARTPGDTSRYQRRDRLCDGSAVGKRRGTGDDPGRSCRHRPARYAWWPSVFHARDDSHDPGLARSNRHVCGARAAAGRPAPAPTSCTRRTSPPWRRARISGPPPRSPCHHRVFRARRRLKAIPDSEKKSEPDPIDAPPAKRVNDAVAYIRSLAELRGRNADWAEKAVREAATLTATAALKERVVDVIAKDVDDLLAQIDGRSVTTAAGETQARDQGARASSSSSRTGRCR